MINKKAIITTDYIYKKYRGKFKLKNAEVNILIETERGMKINHVLFYAPSVKKWVYETYWIPKSKIISIEYLNKLPIEIQKEYDDYVKLEKELGREVNFSLEQYYEKINEGR